jgi:hypothetical protein
VDAELTEAWATAEEYELRWHRSKALNRKAKRIVEKLQKQRRLDRLDIANLISKNERLEAESRSLVNKVERLSLRVIELWGKESKDEN